MMAGEPILSQVALEIRFGRGMVYLDRCGSLHTRMSDELGVAFTEADIPTVEATDFASHDERLSVRFGPKNLVVAQQWVGNPARVEQVAVKAWTVVSEALDVRSYVLRCGMRFFMQWRVASVDDGSRRVLHVIGPSERWQALFGTPTKASHVGIQERPDGSGTRVELGVVQQRVGRLPANLVDKIPPVAIQLDVDHVIEGSSERFGSLRAEEKPRSLGSGQLKDFMRASWQATQTVAKAFSQEAG